MVTTSPQQSPPTTSQILELLKKWQPEKVKEIPAEDHYGLRSIQPIVIAVLQQLLLLAVTWTVYGLFVAVYSPQLRPDNATGFRSFAATLLTVVLISACCTTVYVIFKPVVELIRYRIQPIYISKKLGQMYVGQHGIWWLGMGDSQPDTVDLQNKEATTPDQPWYIRLFFRTNQQVMLPKNDKREKAYIIIIPKAAADKFYEIQGFYQNKRATAVKIPEQSLDIQRATLKTLEELPGKIVDQLSGLTLSWSDDAASDQNQQQETITLPPVAEADRG